MFMIIYKSPSTKEEFKAYYAFRYHILREPLGLPRGTEKDDYEPIAQHFMAVDDATGQIVAVIKLFENHPCDSRFSHLAVREEYQNQGLGKKMVELVEGKARERGWKCIGAFTNLSAVPFLEKLGYKRAGNVESRFDNKLELVWMEKAL
jgi:GNAT superfamily N-acetyltransferase